MSDDPKPKAEEVESKAEPESEEEEEARKTPWWKKLSVVIPAITGLLVATTPLVVMVMPTSSKHEPPKQEQPIYLVPPVVAATPVPTAQRRRDNRPYMATISTPAGLYMRSGPNEKTNQIIKLEQGAQVKVSNCRTTVYIGEVEGQWCQTMYKDEAGNSHRGWMFNAYLIEDTEE